eukprot:15455108-Alexandrium_andersonii.AAC.1
MLGGCLVCNVDFIASAGSAGSCLRFKAGLASKRVLWCSDAFVAAHPISHAILVAKSHQPGSKATWAADRASALALAAQRARSGHKTEVAVFLTLQEKTAPETLVCDVACMDDSSSCAPTHVRRAARCPPAHHRSAARSTPTSTSSSLWSTRRASSRSISGVVAFRASAGARGKPN